MKKSKTLALIMLLGVTFFALFSTKTVSAETLAVNGRITGVELCPQEVCQKAIFTGIFYGKLNRRPAFGTWWVAVNHESLPTAKGSTAAIFPGGHWELRPGSFTFSGDLNSGTLTCMEDDNFKCLKFSVDAELNVEKGGSGTLSVLGELDHTKFPPRITGTLKVVIEK